MKYIVDIYNIINDSNGSKVLRAELGITSVSRRNLAIWV